jgi:hypothetical protein
MRDALSAQRLVNDDAARLCALAPRRGNSVAVFSPQSQWVLGLRGLSMDLFQVLKRIDGRWAAYDGRGTSHVFATERTARYQKNLQGEIDSAALYRAIWSSIKR